MSASNSDTLSPNSAAVAADRSPVGSSAVADIPAEIPAETDAATDTAIASGETDIVAPVTNASHGPAHGHVPEAPGDDSAVADEASEDAWLGSEKASDGGQTTGWVAVPAPPGGSADLYELREAGR